MILYTFSYLMMAVFNRKALFHSNARKFEDFDKFSELKKILGPDLYRLLDKPCTSHSSEMMSAVIYYASLKKNFLCLDRCKNK